MKNINAVSLFGLVAAIWVSFAACSNGSSTPLPQQSQQFGILDNAGNYYELTITEAVGAAHALYAVKPGDSYVLKVYSPGQYPNGTPKVSKGTVTQAGNSLTLKPSTGNTFTVIVEGPYITGFSGTVTYEDGATVNGAALAFPTLPPSLGETYTLPSDMPVYNENGTPYVGGNVNFTMGENPHTLLSVYGLDPIFVVGGKINYTFKKPTSLLNKPTLKNPPDVQLLSLDDFMGAGTLYLGAEDGFSSDGKDKKIIFWYADRDAIVIVGDNPDNPVPLILRKGWNIVVSIDDDGMVTNSLPTDPDFTWKIRP